MLSSPTVAVESIKQLFGTVVCCVLSLDFGVNTRGIILAVIIHSFGGMNRFRGNTVP